MKHVKLFENWMDSEGMPDGDFASGESQFATCYVGDAFVAVGILTPAQENELQSYLDSIVEREPDLAPYTRTEKIDVTGMGHVICGEDGKFTAVPFGADKETQYVYHIDKDGLNTGEDMDGDNVDDSSILFDLVKGAMLVQHGHGSEKVSPRELVENYVGEIE
jgi:hypothetical protein